MSLQTEGNTDLAFDTDVLREYGQKYSDIAKELRSMATKLNTLLADLASDGWTTAAGREFQEMADTNWEENINKYADLLDTLNQILKDASTKYDALTTNYIETTKLKS